MTSIIFFNKGNDTYVKIYKHVVFFLTLSMRKKYSKDVNQTLD